LNLGKSLWPGRSPTPPALTLLLLLVAPAAGAGADSHRATRADRLCASVRVSAWDAEIQEAVRDVASVWSIPVALIKGVIRRESDFHPTAHSLAGAIGLMQVMPHNARRLGFSPEALWQPAYNILAGTRLLAVLLRHYRGDVVSALVAYNARPRRPSAPLPTNGETPAYVHAVLREWARFEACEPRHGH
jgi:soluble lytic murein transglycosylase-like protein